MPRKRPGNLYQRGDIWWGRVTIGGREHRRSLRTDNAREAARRLKDWRIKLERAEFGDGDTPRWKDAVVRWATEVLPGSVKPQVVRRYLTSVAVLEETFGELRMDQITSRTIAEFISRRTGRVTNATIRRDITALSRLLASCIAWGWLVENPARNFDRSIIRERRDPHQAPARRDLETVLRACPAPMAMILRLLDATGMREDEAVTLAAEEVDQERRQVRLVRTKTNRPRTIAWATPGGDATAILSAARKTGTLFPNRDGDAYGNFASNFGQVIRRVAEDEKAAGRPFRRFRVHDLRHGFAIRWLKAGGDIYRLSRHLGHTSVKTTEIYLASLTSDELDAIHGNGTNGGTGLEHQAIGRAAKGI